MVRVRKRTTRKGRLDGNGGGGLDHPARRLLRQYKFSGVPVKLKEADWSDKKIRDALQRGPHPSAKLHSKFLFNEFVNMINLEQWVVLPFSVAKNYLICISVLRASYHKEIVDLAGYATTHGQV